LWFIIFKPAFSSGLYCSLTGYLLFVVSIWAIVQPIRQLRWYWAYFAQRWSPAGYTRRLSNTFRVELACPFILWLLPERTHQPPPLVKDLAVVATLSPVLVAFTFTGYT
jgi:hypothetical protein